jgi:hypothetical protein
VTWVKNRLFNAAGAPIVGQCVKATLMTRPAWLIDSTGRVLGRSSTNTDNNGVWRMNLVPYDRIETQTAALAYYTIQEGDGLICYARVPEVEDVQTELWLRDLLIDPPLSGPTQWISIDRLARLRDVDRESLLAAKPGDFLTLLPNGKWGASRGPMQLSLAWEPHPDQLQSVLVTISGFGGGGARLDWGDGSPPVVITSTAPVAHAYAAPGAYTVTAVDVAWPAFKDTARVAVKDHLHNVHVFLDSDDDWRVLLWLDEPVDGTSYLVDWGDNTPIEEIGGQRIPPHPRVPHQYQEIGTYTITVTDTATMRVLDHAVWIGEIGQVWTYPTSPLRPRLEALWLATGANWQLMNLTSGQVTYQGVVPPSGRVRGERPQDAEPGTYDVELREVINGVIRRRSVRRLVVPTQWDFRLGVDLTWKTSTEHEGFQDVTVSPKTARATCVVSWGDGSASDTVAAGGSVTHTYNLNQLPKAGWLMTVREIGLQDPRTWSRLVAAPREVGIPVLNARTRGAVDLDVLGVDGPTNSDWYRISWGDGANDAVGAVGRWYPAHHTYANNGTYTIAVDGPGVLKPITRTVRVVTYPAPIVTVTEAAGDATRRTVQITVDNRASGGGCLVRLGDSSPVYESAELETFTHRYPPPAVPLPPGWEIYYIIAESKLDPSAKGQAAVQLPFGAERTLQYTIAADGTNLYRARLDITAQDIRKTVVVTWEEGETEEVTVSPTFHDYLDAGRYSVLVGYTDGSESYTTPITIPFAA